MANSHHQTAAARPLAAARKIDKTRWRMRDDNGRMTWHYLEDDETVKNWPMSVADKWYLGFPLELPDQPPAKKPIDAVRNGLAIMEKIQQPSGYWSGEYGGPMFLAPGVVIAWYVTKTPIPWWRAVELQNYLFARAHPDDGGWGLHTDAASSVFGTALNYTALRLVGVDADHPKMVRARATLHRLGGALKGPHWAKFWLAVLGVTKWDGVNPVPPELWLLPDWVPFHPSKWWVHVRMVYLPMGYLWSKRWQAEEDDTIRSLRRELFVEPWESINWTAHRNTIAPEDNFHPKSWLLETANWAIANIWSPLFRWSSLARRAEDWTSMLIDLEDENTDFSDLAPVNKAMNMVVVYARGDQDSYAMRRHQERMLECLWVNCEGLFCNGTNGTQCWDTSFAIQAVSDAQLTRDPRWGPMLEASLKFLDDQQFPANVRDPRRSYRHPRKGGWAFSNRDQGYAVSDCVAEALKSVITLQKTAGFPQRIHDQRIFDAVDTLLTYQNACGGCSSYEPPRAGEWMEMLNPAEVFGRIMVEYTYPECTTAVVTVLSLFHKHWPDYRANEIEAFIARALRWIMDNQLPDGSWYGSWGICFTYATMFALESLASIGLTYERDPASKRGCDFLISKQRPDGGWSESYKGCEKRTYIEHPSGSQVVMTAWALIGLMKANYPDTEPLKKGIRLIMERQQPNGEWLQEGTEGVFNMTCGITYPLYKYSFTMKALGMFATKYPDETVV